MKQRLVVIGNGMAGMKTVEELLQFAPDKYAITVFGAEPHGNYNRILLSSVLCGEKQLSDIVINPRQWYIDNGISLHTGSDKTVATIDRSRQQVITEDGSMVAYDRLLIATGSNAVRADIPGQDLAGVTCFRTIADVQNMLTYTGKAQHAVVLGGGLLGLEAANGLVQRGMSVTVIHNHDVLLNRQLDETAGKLLQAELERRGVQFKMKAKVQQLISDNNNHVCAVRFTDESQLDCDLFVMAIGVQPNMALAKSAGLVCERGIVVNDNMLSSDANIYAVGECVQHRGDTFGLVAPLFVQAKVCAVQLSEQGSASYVTPPTATKLKVTGIKLFSIGDFLGDAQTESILFSDKKKGVYKKLVVKANQLVGAVLYGDTADWLWYQELLEQQVDIADIRSQIIFGQACA